MIEEGSARAAPAPVAAPRAARFTRTAQAAAPVPTTSFLRKRAPGEVVRPGESHDPLAIANQRRRAEQQQNLAAGTASRSLGAEPRQSTGEVKNRQTDLWAIQVGAFRRFAAARNQVMRAARAQPRILNGTEVVISAVKTRGKTLYRARLSGLTETDARRVCKSLKRKDIGCLTVPAPPPNSIAAY